MDTTSDVTVSEPSTLDAVVRAVEAGQRMLLDRVELIELEVKKSVRSAGETALWAGVGLLYAVLGWVTIAAALVALLDLAMPLWASLAIVGVGHTIVGAVLVVTSRYKPHAPRLRVESTKVRSA